MRDGLEKIIGGEVRLPEALACAEELVRGGAGNDEVFGEIYASDRVESRKAYCQIRKLEISTAVSFPSVLYIPTNKRLPRSLVDARDHGTHKPRAKPPLVQTTAHQIGERLRTDISLFPQPVHVDFVSEELADGADVGREPREAEVDLRAVGEDFGEVVGDGEGLEAEAQVAGDGYAVLAYHCYAGAAV